MADPEDIRAWQRLDNRITTSGRIEEKDLPRLAAIGVRKVINLAPESHPDILDREGELLALHGISYVNLPVNFTAPEQAFYDQFVAEIDRDLMPVHVHCVANYRVSAFFYRYNRGKGMPEEKARALMERHWSPGTSDQLTVRPWAEFISGG